MLGRSCFADFDRAKQCICSSVIPADHGNVWCRAVSGGALSIDSSGPTGLAHVSVTGCNFTHNAAHQDKFTATPILGELQGSGGALRMFVSALWLSETSFVGNSAASAGGAILSGQTCLQVSQPVCTPPRPPPPSLSLFPFLTVICFV